MSNNAFSLVVKIADQDPVKHDLEADTITFGRGPDNGIQVLVAEVSVAHGELVKAGDAYKIIDKGSSNGTKVNGRPTNPGGTALAPMDKILLGATTPVYFVPTAVADSGSLEELIAGIESAPKAAPVATAVAVSPAAPSKPAPLKPAPVSPAAPIEPAAVQPAAALPVPGASTVKLAQVQTPRPGAPAPGGPLAPKVGGPPVAPAPLAPRPGGPLAPVPVKPAGGAVPAPVPLKKAAPKAPSIPLPTKKPGA
jgi:hypothetical protein